jgi:hypothetical protein
VACADLVTDRFDLVVMRLRLLLLEIEDLQLDRAARSRRLGQVLLRLQDRDLVARLSLSSSCPTAFSYFACLRAVSVSLSIGDPATTAFLFSSSSAWASVSPRPA